ncbi:MAG: acyl carrier protein [Bryobacteraceae bacterium]|jgi:acyl carrier protein
MRDPELVLQRLRHLADTSLGLNLTARELAALTRLDEVAGLDSLTVLEFVAAVEKEFGLTFAEDQLRASFLADLPALAGYLSARGGASC